MGGFIIGRESGFQSTDKTDATSSTPFHRD